MPQQLLKNIFGTDFSEYQGDQEGFLARFLAHKFSLANLYAVFDYIAGLEHPFPHPFDKTKEIIIPGCAIIGDRKAADAAVFLAHTHGNEPVGLSAFLLALALSGAGLLKGKIYAVIGNIEAARRYWEVFRDNPEAPVYKRSFFRTVSASDEPDEAKDLNRLPPKWSELAVNNLQEFYDKILDSEHYIIRRALKILTLALRPEVKLFFDVHSSRQSPDGLRIINVSQTQMKMLEEGKFGHILKGVPEDLRIFPAGLLETLGIEEPQITVKMLVEIARGENIIPIIGIECGHHENLQDTMPRSAWFANALLYNLGLSEVMPKNYEKDAGEFYKYHVIGRKGIGYLSGQIVSGDVIYPVKPLAEEKPPYYASGQIIAWKLGKAELIDIGREPDVKKLEEVGKTVQEIYSVYQFKEMEKMQKGQVAMIGVPSGNKFTMPEDAILLFPTKSSALYGKKPGMWPVVVDSVKNPANAKFSYVIKDVEKIILK